MKQERSTTGYEALAVAVILFGFALRLYRIDWQSVWNDEIFAISLSGGPWRDLQDFLVEDFKHPPLHYYLLRIWFLVAGYGAFQARLLSVLFGSLSLVVIYLTGKYLAGIRTGIVAALLLGMSLTGVRYSHEARSYAMAMFFGLCLTYTFLRATREGRIRYWAWAVLLAAALLYSHYFGVFVVAALGVFALVYRSRYRAPWTWWTGGALVVGLLFLPWLSTGVIESALGYPQAGKLTSMMTWKVPFVALNVYNNGKLFGVNQWSPWWTYVVGGLLFTLPAFYAFVRCLRERSTAGDGPSRREAVLLANLLWVLPLGAVLFLNLIGFHPYTPRYASLGAGGYCLAVALGIDLLSSRLRAAVLAGIILFSLAGLRSHFFLPYKEDYRGGMQYLMSDYRIDDCCVFLPSYRWGENPRFWSVYYRDRPPRRVFTAEDISSGRETCDRIWLFRDRTAWIDREPESTARSVRSIEQAYRKVEGAEFLSISVGLYVPMEER